MIELQSFSVRRGGSLILSDITLSIERGELLAVVGPNGSGKSTLLRSILGRLEDTSGKLQLDGQSVHSYKPQERAALLAWLPQRQQIAEPLSVWEVTAAARYRFTESPAMRKRATLEALKDVGMDHFSHRIWNSLSGGEAQRVSMASLVAQEAGCWLLDEPANHLDPAVQQQVYSQIIGKWNGGQSIVVVTHDLNLLRRSISAQDAAKVRAIGLKDGRLCFESPLDDSQLSGKLSELYSIHVEEIEIQGRKQFGYGSVFG